MNRGASCLNLVWRRRLCFQNSLYFASKSCNRVFKYEYFEIGNIVLNINED